MTTEEITPHCRPTAYGVGVKQTTLFGGIARQKATLTPKERYEKWDSEFHFDFDPCPYPRPRGFDGLKVPWGNSNYVNPPFSAGESLVQWVNKALAEHSLGKTVVMVLPVYYAPAKMIANRAVVRPIDDCRVWETPEGKKARIAVETALFILNGEARRIEPR